MNNLNENELKDYIDKNVEPEPEIEYIYKNEPYSSNIFLENVVTNETSLNFDLIEYNFDNILSLLPKYYIDKTGNKHEFFMTYNHDHWFVGYINEKIGINDADIKFLKFDEDYNKSLDKLLKFVEENKKYYEFK